MSGKNAKTSIINEYHLNRHQPDKPQFAIHDLKTYMSKHQRDTTKPHIHSFYQVIWFRKGAGKHFVDFKSFDVADNTFFFVAKNQVHYFDQHLDYEGVLMHFNEAFLVKENDTDFCLKYNVFSNPYDNHPCCRIGNDINDVLDQYISLIKLELEAEEDFGREELLRIYLKAFLIQVQRSREESEKKEVSGSLWDEKRMQLIKFVNLVDDNYNKGLTVADYSQLLYISTRTLSNLTYHLLNKTPSQMIRERIVLEAQRLLLNSNLNINQVGYRLGFDDASYFIKYFKKHTKISPSEFRKSIL